jgi:multidrug resistance protein, MATE family
VKLTHRTYLALAVPLTLSTITTPLLGAVDTAVVGRIPDPAYLGAVALGTIIFNTMYWLFGFLRVSTSGFAAQAIGAKDEMQSVLALMRPLFIAAIIGFALVLMQKPIVDLALSVMGPESDVELLTAQYYGIRIWGVPFALMNYAILGWLMGSGKIKAAVMIPILMNLLNILLDLLFVLVFSWGVAGVAAATLIAEIFAFALGAMLIWKIAAPRFQFPKFKQVAHPGSMKKMMLVNQDLFIRTLCLLAVFNLFTMQSASFGTETLAANAVLLQVHFIMAYFYDGLANASSIMAGQAVGAKNRHAFRRTVALSCQWAVISSVLLAGGYYLFKEPIIRAFTNIPEVLALISIYDSWLLLFPLVSSFGIILYGLFTGATETAPIRNSMILSFLVFLVGFATLVPALQNHGLWLSFIIFAFGRSFFLSLYMPSLIKKLSFT